MDWSESEFSSNSLIFLVLCVISCVPTHVFGNLYFLRAKSLVKSRSVWANIGTYPTVQSLCILEIEKNITIKRSTSHPYIY